MRTFRAVSNWNELIYSIKKNMLNSKKQLNSIHFELLNVPVGYMRATVDFFSLLRARCWLIDFGAAVEAGAILLL